MFTFISTETPHLLYIFLNVFSPVGAATPYSAQWLGYGLYEQEVVVARARYSLVQSPIQWIPAVKQLGCEPNHSATPSAKVKKAWNSISNPLYVLQVQCLIQHRDNFAFQFSHVSKIVLFKLLFSCTTVKIQTTYHYHLGGRFQGYKPSTHKNNNTAGTSNFTVATFLI